MAPPTEDQKLSLIRFSLFVILLLAITLFILNGLYLLEATFPIMFIVTAIVGATLGKIVTTKGWVYTDTHINPDLRWEG